MSSSRIHCCYIVIGTEFKEKHILEQDEFFFSVQSSALGLKEKTFVLFSSLRTPDHYFILENSRPLSSPWGPWTSYQPT